MEEGMLQVQPNIEKVTLSDNIERSFIDTFEKLYYWINTKFEEQKKNNKENDELVIDLSNLIILFQEGSAGIRYFWIGYLAGKIDGIISVVNKKEFDPKSNDGISLTKEVEFEVKYKINFENSFIYNMAFGGTRFLKKVSFKNVYFMAGARLEGAIFESYVNLMHINIDQIVNHNKLPNINGVIMFKNITFKDEVSLAAENWINCINFNFNNNIFEKDVNFTLCSIDKNMPFFYDFSNSIFNGNVFFDGRARPDVKPKIISNINFNDSHFNKKLKIWNIKLGSISMQNCRFNDSVSITHNYYDNNFEFDFTFSTINSLFFMDSDLGGLKGEPIKLSNEISFKKSLITKEAFIFLRNINNGDSYPKTGTLNFEYANILGTITVQDSKLEKIKLNKSTLIGNISIENVDTGYDCRESITKIKDSFIKRNDVVNSLTYKAKEMEYYSDSLSEYFSCKNLKKIISESFTSILTYFKSLKFHHIIVSPFVILFKYLILPFILLPLSILLSTIPIKSFEKIREYTLLYLNRISNSFGMSWGQGVLFTCVTACAFFILINTVGIKSSPLFVWGWNGWDSFGDVWKYYLNMFYLLDFKEKFKDLLTGKSIELNALGDTLFFVSKIFVSYGIYQTISAFRKYGK